MNESLQQGVENLLSSNISCFLIYRFCLAFAKIEQRYSIKIQTCD